MFFKENFPSMAPQNSAGGLNGPIATYSDHPLWRSSASHSQILFRQSPYRFPRLTPRATTISGTAHTTGHDYDYSYRYVLLLVLLLFFASLQGRSLPI
jgi:hypothetical protein